MSLDRVTRLALGLHVRGVEQAHPHPQHAVEARPAPGQGPDAFPERGFVLTAAHEQGVSRCGGRTLGRGVARAVGIGSGVRTHGAVGRAPVHDEFDVAEQVRLYVRRRRGVEGRQAGIVPVANVRCPHELLAPGAFELHASHSAQQGGVDIVVLVVPVVVNPGAAGNGGAVDVPPVAANPGQRQFRLFPAAGDSGNAGPVFDFGQVGHCARYLRAC